MMWGVAGHPSQDRVAQLTQPGAREDGSDVADEWRRLLEARGPGMPVTAVAEDFADRLRAGNMAAKSLSAALDYPAAERLPLVRQQALVMRLRDEFWEQAPRVRSALPNATLLDLSEYRPGFHQRRAATIRSSRERISGSLSGSGDTGHGQRATGDSKNPILAVASSL